MTQHPGRTISIYDISEILGRAFPLAVTPTNIMSGFRVTGICPINPNIFTDDEFMSSFVTDRPNNENSGSLTDRPTSPVKANENQILVCATPSTSGTVSNKFRSPEDIQPHPKAVPRVATTKGRKKASTMILTDTPEKARLEEQLMARTTRQLSTACKTKPINKRKLTFESRHVSKKSKTIKEMEVYTSESESLPSSSDSET